MKKLLLLPIVLFLTVTSFAQEQYHFCKAQEGISCFYEIALACPAGFQDGCITRETTNHKCVPVKGDSCWYEYMLECPAGFQDACLE